MTHTDCRPAEWLQSGLLALILAAAGYMAYTLDNVREGLATLAAGVAVNGIKADTNAHRIERIEGKI